MPSKPILLLFCSASLFAPGPFALNLTLLAGVTGPVSIKMTFLRGSIPCGQTEPNQLGDHRNASVICASMQQHQSASKTDEEKWSFGFPLFLDGLVSTTSRLPLVATRGSESGRLVAAIPS